MQLVPDVGGRWSSQDAEPTPIYAKRAPHSCKVEKAPAFPGKNELKSMESAIRPTTLYSHAVNSEVKSRCPTREPSVAARESP